MMAGGFRGAAGASAKTGWSVAKSGILISRKNRPGLRCAPSGLMRLLTRRAKQRHDGIITIKIAIGL
ncbi:hypothetical protein QWJ07_13770 [Frankia sp. RB7]|nr:hypothetical protein [Frankia sp. RB7]